MPCLPFGFEPLPGNVNGPDVNGPDVNGPDVNGPDVNGPDVNGPDVNGQMWTGIEQGYGAEKTI